MIEQQSVHQQVDQAVNDYVEAHGPTCSQVYREGVVNGIAMGLALGFQALRATMLQPIDYDYEQQREKDVT